jgi:hypothetical protein
MPAFVIVVDLLARAVWLLAYGLAILIVSLVRSVLQVAGRHI